MSTINVIYQVYSKGKWLPNVTNLTDYAGVYGNPIQCVYANLSNGSIKYRVHTTNGSWLPWVVDRSDYAGIYGTNIDGIQMETIGLSGYNAKYRAYVGGRWLPWVVGLEDYAGIYGNSIEGIQVEIISSNSGGSGSGGPGYSRILKVTSPLMYGEDVKAVQNKLNSLGYNAGTADGYYGTNTKNAVVRFQTSKGLSADGDVGPLTWNALFSSSGGSGGGTLPPSNNSRKVFIDPGHGGSDPGAVGNGLNEKDVVLSISKKVGQLLKAKGIAVEYARTNDSYVSLDGRAQMANNWGAGLFVSIHANSFSSSSARGTECYTYPATDSANKALSANVSKSIANKFGIPNRGHKEADFAVLRLTSMPAILVETAFISNPSDATLLKNKQDDFALCIANEIYNYFGGSQPNFDSILTSAGKTGLFSDLPVTFDAFNVRKYIKTLSFKPHTILFGEVSLSSTIGAGQTISLSAGAQSLAASATTSMNSLGISMNFTEQNLKSTFSKIGLTLNGSDTLRFNVELVSPTTIEITVEHKVTIAGVDLFQRFIISMSDVNNYAYAPILALSSDPIDSELKEKIGVSLAVVSLVIMCGLIFASGGAASPALIPNLTTIFGTFLLSK